MRREGDLKGMRLAFHKPFYQYNLYNQIFFTLSVTDLHVFTEKTLLYTNFLEIFFTIEDRL